MWGIDYYLLPSQDYFAIDQTDLFMLDLIESRIDSEEQMIIPEEFYQKEDDNGVNAAEYLFGRQQNDNSTFLYEIIGKKTVSAKTYRELQQEENIGYVAFQKEQDVLKKETTVQSVCKNMEDCTEQNDDLLKVRRYYMMKVDSYEQYIERIYKAFPSLLFHKEAFCKIGKLGAFKECVNELHRHLCILNDFGKKLYFELGQKEEVVFAYLRSKYDITCSGKGSNERKEFKLEFDGIKVTCNPHTKFYNGNNDQRIYFCWGRDEIENHKIVIARIGNHWDK